MTFWMLTDVAVAILAACLGWSVAWRMVRKRMARRRLRERLNLIYRDARRTGYSA